MDSELQELETTLRRFDGFKETLKPSPQALERALLVLPTERRMTRLHLAIAPVVALVAFVLFTPSTTPASQMAVDILREERQVDEALATSTLTNEEVESADSALDELASLL